MVIKIKEEGADEPRILDFSKYLYCTSSSVKVSNAFHNFNGMYGQVYKAGSGSVGSRSFSISGNFEASSPQDVERFRGEVFCELFDKPLMLFLEEKDDTYYNCVLDGNVSTTYNAGWEISRVFNLSFNLLAYEPFRFGEEKSYIISNWDDITTLYYEGDVPCFPKIYIWLKGKIKKVEQPLLQNEDTQIKFNKEIVSLDKKACFCIQNGLIRPLRKTQISTFVLDSRSVLNPFKLFHGENEISFNTNCFEGRYRITMSFQNIYF